MVEQRGAPASREAFVRSLERTRSVLVELGRIDGDDAVQLSSAVADLDAYAQLSDDLFHRAAVAAETADAFEEERIDPVLDPLLALAATGSREHVAEAGEHVGEVDHLQSVLLVATPIVFGVGLVTVALSAAVLRSSHRQVEEQSRRNRHQARHDALTGLPNRTLLRERADAAFAGAGTTGRPLALLLLDLDRFKEVNDTLGHRYGDLVLQSVAQRLAQSLRPGDTVARLGGDEFAVLLPDVGDGRAAERIAAALASAVDASMEVEGIGLEVEASIGVSLSGVHGEDVDALMRRADIAMYAAKARGSGVCLYDEGLDGHSLKRLGLIGELRRALDQDELHLHYQPKVDLASGTVRGVEALLRWQHPERGSVSPAEFVPMAEHTGLIHPLTRFVLAQALAQCRRWLAEGRCLQVAVNISVRNLLDDDFVDDVRALVAAAGVPASCLELELTESAIMTEPARARSALRQLAELGLTLSVDDFGAGYTSLAHLKELPVHQLKVDRSFVSTLVQDADDRAVVRAIVQLAGELGLGVIAEGIEDEPTRRALLDVGCGTGQGWHFSQALPASELSRWLEARAPQPVAAGRV